MEKELSKKIMDVKKYKKGHYLSFPDDESSDHESYFKLDLSKEYIMLAYYDSHNGNTEIANLFSLMSNSLENRQWSFINVNEAQLVINRYFEFLSLKKRYIELCHLSKNELGFDNSGFHINEFTFETLDEVQKALNNKSFI